MLSKKCYNHLNLLVLKYEFNWRQRSKQTQYRSEKMSGHVIIFPMLQFKINEQSSLSGGDIPPHFLTNTKPSIMLRGNRNRWPWVKKALQCERRPSPMGHNNAKGPHPFTGSPTAGLSACDNCHLMNINKTFS